MLYKADCRMGCKTYPANQVQLDVSVQAQILRLMQKLQRETGVSYLLISHDLEVLRKVCHRIAYLDNGTITSIETITRVVKI